MKRLASRSRSLSTHTSSSFVRAQAGAGPKAMATRRVPGAERIQSRREEVPCRFRVQPAFVPSVYRPDGGLLHACFLRQWLRQKETRGKKEALTPMYSGLVDEKAPTP